MFYDSHVKEFPALINDTFYEFLLELNFLSTVSAISRDTAVVVTFFQHTALTSAYRTVLRCRLTRLG